jgi:non-homologous end joining protein Ku
MAARALWEGVITFQGMKVPVRLYSAVVDRDVHFHLLHKKDHARLQQRMVNPRTGEVVDRDDLRKAFPVDETTYVLLDDDEIDALAPEPSRTIEVRLKTLIDRERKKGTDVVDVPEETEDADLDAMEDQEETDLLETIRRSLGLSRGGRGHTTANGRARSSVKKTGGSRGDRSYAPSTAKTQARRRPRRPNWRH